MITKHRNFLLSVLVLTVFFAAVSELFSYDIELSVPSGFYSDSFSLRIDGGTNFDIYYTLDGSEPTVRSTPYDRDSGILISDASANPNLYSARTDISAGFQQELIEKHAGENPGYTVPDYPVDKCTIVRAATFDSAGNPLDQVQGVYFVGLQEKEAYKDIYTVSIHGESEDLFGYEDGILVTGKTFDDFLDSYRTGSEVTFPEDWWTGLFQWWSANYRQEGIQWERPVSITVFNDQQQVVLDQTCGIRIHGGGSRGYVNRSIRCIAREEYAGRNVFSVDWFGETVQPRKFVLFAGGDDYRFKFKDYLANRLGESLNIATMDFIPCNLFINGEYWGFYFITENYNKNYISDHYQVNENNVVMIKNDQVSEGLPEDYSLLVETVAFITENDMTEKANYEKACQLIDMEGFMDYYALQMYIANSDWPENNYALWRTRESEDSPYGDCRWRFMLFDVNSGGVSSHVTQVDSLGDVLESDEVFASLFRNKIFREQFASRLLYMGNTLLSKEVCSSFIDAYQEAYQEALMQNSRRFFRGENEEALASYLEAIRTFFSERYGVVSEFVTRHLEEYA